jgi:xylulokinase
MLLGLDLGTGSCKALLLSAEGLVLGEASRTYGVRSPQAGWAESNPLEWWEAIGLAAREAVGGYGAEVRGIGLSGQMHGTVYVMLEVTRFKMRFFGRIRVQAVF